MPRKKTQPETPKKESKKTVKKPLANQKVEAGGVVIAKKKLAYAKEKVLNGGDKKMALQKAGYSMKNPRQLAHYLDTLPEVAFISNLVKQQIKSIQPLTLEEVKQLGAELSTVSIVDLIEEDGTIDIIQIKKRGLGRFVKEYEQDITFDKDGKKTIKTKVKGYDRIQALRMVASVQRDEDNRDIQIIQTIASLFSERPELLKEKHRVFQLFSKKFGVSQEKVEDLFDRFGNNYLVG